MPFTKIWTGATSDLQLATNWQAISVRTSAFRWQPSGSGTSEYYLQTSGGGNPGLQAAPTSVYANGSAVTSGSVGSLAAGRWAYGDNDALGYSTIYIRLSDSTDPDTKAADYVTFYQIPKATENIAFPVSGGLTISSNLDLSAVAIGDFQTAANWKGVIGSQSAWCRIDPDSFLWQGGEGYIDLGAAAIPIRVIDTVKPNAGYQALHLRGSAITVADILGGSVGIAAFSGDTASITTLRMFGKAYALLGAGATVTTIHQRDGQIVVRCSPTTINVRGGDLNLEYAAAPTTINLYSGTLRYGSSGNIGTINQYGGTVDCRASGSTRTIGTHNCYGGTIIDAKEAVTTTTFNDYR